MSCPVLLLAYNRPGKTEQVLDALRENPPTRLYFAVDGPRTGDPTDRARVETTRRLATRVGWVPHVETRFLEANAGCRHGVSSALNWFFGNESRGAVLEEDCVPDKTFLTYCSRMLERYESDESIMHINGSNYEGHHSGSDTYRRSRVVNSSGWASWSRAWRHFQLDPAHWTGRQRREIMRRVTTDPGTRRFFEFAFRLTAQRKNSSWAYPWMLSVWARDGRSIVPGRHLVRNIGLEAGGTHTSKERHLRGFESSSMRWPLEEIVEDDLLDELDRRFWRTFHLTGSARRLVKMRLSTWLPRRIFFGMRRLFR